MADRPKSPEEKRKFDDLMNQMGGHFPDYGGKPDPADPRNKLKSAELLLEKFKKNISDEKFEEELGWTKEQIANWMKDQEATIAALRKQAEKGDWGTSRAAKGLADGGPSAGAAGAQEGWRPAAAGARPPRRRATPTRTSGSPSTRRAARRPSPS